MLVDFYHLTSSPLDRVLPRICERLLGDGERLLIVGDAGQLDRMDNHLWAYGRDSFLPHGKDSGPYPEQQPVLLAPTPAPINGAKNIALADGIWRDEALGFSRTFYFFDESNVVQARSAWRMLKDNPNVQCRYWKQDGGKWVQGP
jgi:DNA polymerase-3 subunit chi